MRKLSDPGPVTTSPPPGRAVTPRSVLIGTTLVAGLCWIVPYNDYVVGNTFLIGSYLPLAAVLAIFVLVVLVNAPLHAWRPGSALRTGELAVILIMLLVAGSVPGQGLLRAFLPSLAAPFYFGQQNQAFWDALVKMGLPAWMFPVESIEQGRADPAITEFYGRTPAGQAMPLAAWIVPLAGWGVFLGAMALTLVSLAFLLRVQWAHNERLAFPLAQLQLSLLEAPEEGRALNRLFRSRLFWIAGGAVFAVHSLSALSEYFPKQVTSIGLSYDFRALMDREPWRFMPADIKRSTVYFTFIGIAYFIQSRTAFSLWSIWVITQFLTMYARTMQADIPLPAWRDQHLGSCVVYVIAILWLGRQYWGRIVRSFASRDPDLRDGRWSLVGVLFGIAVMLAWLIFGGGVGVSMTLLIVGFILMAHVTTARIVAETGLPFIRTLATAQQIVDNLPARSLAGRDVLFAAYSTTNGVGFNRESLLGFTQHGLKIGEGAGVVPRETPRLIGVIAWALVLAFAVASVSSLRVYYGYNTQLGSGEPRLENKYGMIDQPQDTLVRPVQNWGEGRFPRPPHTPWVHWLIGAGVTATLQVLTWRLSWWPFVPIGFLVAGTYTFIAQAWFSLMIGWVAKVLILRFGGAGFYQRTSALFVGLIFGEAFAAAVWLVINMLLASAGMDYHPIKFLPN